MKKPNLETTETIHEISINKVVAFLFSFIVLGLLGGSVYLFTNKANSQSISSINAIHAQKDTKMLVAKIGSLFDLPTDETPTVATVSDKSKLQKQPFFAKAENGDRVLIYTNAKKAILYRPSIHKIMEVGPLAINSPSDTSSVGEEEVQVSIYNGTKTPGLAAVAEKKLMEKYTNLKVKEKKDAKNDYTSTVVIDTTGNNSETSKKIARLLGGTVAEMPTQESKPQGEILVIMGK